MKKLMIVAVLSVCSLSAHAISHGYRAALERSGCTEVSDAAGTCDTTKTKAQNAADTQLAEFLHDSVMNQSIDSAAVALIGYGWKANNGNWYKGKKKLHLNVINGKVASIIQG